MWGYAYMLADGEPVVKLCKDELSVQRSICAMSFATDADAAAFAVSLSMLRPVEA